MQQHSSTFTKEYTAGTAQLGCLQWYNSKHCCSRPQGVLIALQNWSIAV